MTTMEVELTDAPTFRIFLSYSHKDKDLSGKLKEKLESIGFKSFLAHEDARAQLTRKDVFLAMTIARA